MSTWVLVYQYQELEVGNAAFDRLSESIGKLRSDRRYTGPLTTELTGFDEKNDEVINESFFIVIVGDGELPLELHQIFDKACFDGLPRMITEGDAIAQIVYQHKKGPGRHL